MRRLSGLGKTTPSVGRFLLALGNVLALSLAVAAALALILVFGAFAAWLAGHGGGSG